MIRTLLMRPISYACLLYIVSMPLVTPKRLEASVSKTTKAMIQHEARRNMMNNPDISYNQLAKETSLSFSQVSCAIVYSIVYKFYKQFKNEKKTCG